ncbi:MAG: hypothetical protein ACXQT4_03210 [Methanotrichaceae archaeon]
MPLIEIECPNCHEKILARFIADIRTTTFRTGPHVTCHNKIIGCYPQSIWRRETWINIYANEIKLSVYEGDDRDLWIETLMTEHDLPRDIAEDIMERIMFLRNLVNTPSGLMKRMSISESEKISYIPDQMPSL